MATIIPAPGELKETAQRLIQLAGDVPEIVRTVHGGTAFEVPDELADAFHGEQPASKPRRRGRTPRVTTEE